MAVGPGTGGNVLAALCSLLFPGLGQLLQGRVFMALIQFVIAVVVWILTVGFLGWIINIWSAISAARFQPPPPPQ